MRLFRLEIKRVLKTRMTWILLVCAFVFSFLMAYIPATFPRYTYQDENGQSVHLKGLEAFRAVKEQRAAIEGEVTPQKIRKAVEVYQRDLGRYGAESMYELPEEVFYGEIMIYEPFFSRIREAFANPENGFAADLMELDPKEAEAFYEKCPERMAALMDMEQKGHPSAQEKGMEMYGRVGFPFYYYEGVGSTSMDYQALLMFLLTIFCAMIAAHVFSTEYQTGADDILRCTKYGRVHLGVVKVLSAVTVCGSSFLACGVIWILVTNSLFGWESTKSSIQMIFSVSSLLEMNVGQLEWRLLRAGFLCLLASVSFTLFLSSRMKSTVSSMGFALFFCILPVLIYFAVPGTAGEWMRCLLPGGGLGVQNCLLYTVVDLVFLHVGGFSIWNTYVILIAAAAEIPVFTGLAVYGYCRRSG